MSCFGCSFSGKMFTSAVARAGRLKGTLKPLKQVYNPTKKNLFPSPAVDWLHFLLPGETS